MHWSKKPFLSNEHLLLGWANPPCSQGHRLYCHIWTWKSRYSPAMPAAFHISSSSAISSSFFIFRRWNKMWEVTAVGATRGKRGLEDERFIRRVVLQKSTAVHFTHQNFGKLSRPQAGSGTYKLLTYLQTVAWSQISQTSSQDNQNYLAAPTKGCVFQSMIYHAAWLVFYCQRGFSGILSEVYGKWTFQRAGYLTVLPSKFVGIIFESEGM